MFGALLAALTLAPGLLLAAFFGSLIQRVAGMGFGIALSGFTLALYDPFTAVYLSSIIGVGVTVVTLLQLWGHIQWAVIWPLVAPTLIFMILGFGIALVFGEHPLVRLGFQGFGLLAIGFALRALLRPGARLTQPIIARPWIGGGITGFLSGTIGMPGVALGPYFLLRGIVSTGFIATITPLFFGTALTRLALGAGADFGRADLTLAFLASLLAVFGVFVGGWMARFVSVGVQRWLLLGLIFISAGRLVLGFAHGLVLLLF